MAYFIPAQDVAVIVSIPLAARFSPSKTLELCTMAIFVNFCPKIIASIMTLETKILIEFKKFNYKE